MINTNLNPGAASARQDAPSSRFKEASPSQGSSSGTRANVRIQGNRDGAPTVTGTISGDPGRVTLTVNGESLNPGEVLTQVETEGGENGEPTTTTETTTTLSADGKTVTTKTVTTVEEGGSTRRSTRISTRPTSSLTPAPTATPAKTPGEQEGADTETGSPAPNTGTSRAGDDFQGTNRTAVRATVTNDGEGTTVTGTGEGNPDNVDFDVDGQPVDPVEDLDFVDTTVEEGASANSEGVVEDRLFGVTGTDGDDTLVRSNPTVGITLDGGAGDDTLIGTEGARFENFIGGDGVDTFVLNGAGGTNRIEDFDASSEKIVLNVEGINSLEDLLNASPFGNLADFRFDDGTRLNLSGVLQRDLSAENFDFNGGDSAAA